MDIESSLLEIPDTEYSADITMSSDDFGKLVNQLSIFGKDILFELGDTIKVTGKGDDGKMSAMIKEDDIIMYAGEEDMDLSLEYAGGFIVMMTAFSKLNKKIQIHFSSEMPMKIQYGLDNFMDNNEDEEDEESVDTNYIRFFLAPKVQDD
jgi:DNA polymerase III sliding clamp (beta) subunit (PCNA family)